MTSGMMSSRRDGGYGWVIVFAFFLSELLMDGIRFSFGMLYVEWLQYFQRGKGETAWIGSILIGIYNLGGPVFVVIVNRLGCRPSYILGALLSTIGYVLSFFATDVYFLYLSFGVLPGLGFGIVFLAGTVSVGRYFLKKRALAMGIAYSGTGIGTMVFNPLAWVLLDNFGWRGTMFIYSSLALNLCVLGSLHRPLIAAKDNQETEALDKTGKSEQCPYDRNNQLDSVTAKSDVTVADGLKADGNKLYKPPERDQPYENNKNTSDAIANDIGHFICDKTGDKDETINVCENWSDDIEDAKVTVLKNPKEDIDSFRKHTSVILVNETAAKENDPMLQRLPNGSAEHSKDHADGTFRPVPHTPEFKRTKYLNHAHNLSQLDDSGSQGSLPNIHKRKLSDTLMSKQNRSLSSLPTLKKSHLTDSQNMLGSNASFEILFERQQCLLTDNECYIHKHDNMQSNNMFVTIIRNAFPKELVTNTNFIILMVATFFFGIAAYIPVALLPDYCLYVGCRIENTGWLISVFGVTGILSRLMAGWITDIPCLNRFVFSISLILVIGVITLLLPVLHSFELLMAYAAVFGLVMGATYVVQPMFLFEYFGDEYLVEIVGIMMLVYGVSNLIGTPIAGWLFDSTGDYNISFLFAGASCILSVVLHIFVLCSKPKRYAKAIG